MKQFLALPFTLFLILLLAGCGGSSSDGERGPSNDDPAAVSGVVVDAVNGAPLAGVTIGAADGSGASTTSAVDGSFRFGDLRQSDAPNLRFVLDGYREELYARPSLGDGGTGIDPRPTLGDGEGGAETIALVPDDNAGEGGLSGSLTDSDGAAIVGAVIRFIAGINFRDGTVVVTTDTADDGSWGVLGLPYGNYTCIILIRGEEPIYRTVQVFGGIERTGQDVVAPVTIAPPGTGGSPLPDPDATDFVPGLATWQLGRYGFSAQSGNYVPAPIYEQGYLGLGDENTDTDGPNGVWSSSDLLIAHTLSGAGTYRLVTPFPGDLSTAAAPAEKVASVQVGINSPLNAPPISAMTYYTDGDVDAAQTIEATVDGLGRYSFSTSSPITVRPVAVGEPLPGLQSEFLLVIENAFAP